MGVLYKDLKYQFQKFQKDHKVQFFVLEMTLILFIYVRYHLSTTFYSDETLTPYKHRWTFRNSFLNDQLRIFILDARFETFESNLDMQ